MLNAISIVQKMHKPALALLGTGVEFQYEELRRLGYRTFYLALDPDQSGKRGTEKLKEALINTGFIYTVDLPEGRDINDLAVYDDETFRKLIEMYTRNFIKRP